MRSEAQRLEISCLDTRRKRWNMWVRFVICVAHLCHLSSVDGLLSSSSRARRCLYSTTTSSSKSDSSTNIRAGGISTSYSNSPRRTRRYTKLDSSKQKIVDTPTTSTTSNPRDGGFPRHVTRQVSFELPKRIKTPTSIHGWRRLLFSKRKKHAQFEFQRLAFSYDINFLDLSSTEDVNDTTAIIDQEKVSASIPVSENDRDEVSMIHPMFRSLFERILEYMNQQQNKRGFKCSPLQTFQHALSNITADESIQKITIGIILIHPIGVGIGKWYYNRLLDALFNLNTQHGGSSKQTAGSQLLVVAPDLLGSGSACNPVDSPSGEELRQLPLLTVQDWAAQTSRLMVDLEQDYPEISSWCLVANGGCSPIALEVAKQSVRAQQQIGATIEDSSSKDSVNGTNSTELTPFDSSHVFQRPVSNVILSSVPRLPFFLPPDSSSETRKEKKNKVLKSYKTLCGPLGRLFWWYALRKQGKFIQSFSERNLVANSENLGDDWTPNCVATARMYNGKSRYSTFSFLAGSLQMDGCRDSLKVLRGSNVNVDIIQGRDRRRNRAKSVFWRKLQRRKGGQRGQPSQISEETLEQVLQKNGNSGKVLQVGGRVSLAHEDAWGYAKAITDLLGVSASDPSDD